jgi:hypothetical protein
MANYRRGPLSYVIPAKAGTQYAAAILIVLGACWTHDLILTETPAFTGSPLSRG